MGEFKGAHIVKGPGEELKSNKAGLIVKERKAEEPASKELEAARLGGRQITHSKTCTTRLYGSCFTTVYIFFFMIH